VTEPANDCSQVTAVILAGGLGTRLLSVVADRPKVLAEINGKPFLSYLFDQLVSMGCRSVILCTGYLGEQIQQTFGEQFGKLRLRYSKEHQPLGTAGALRLALPLLVSDPVLVMNGDSYCGADLKAYWDWYRGCRPRASLLLTQVSNSGRYGSVAIDGVGRVVQFLEKSKDQGAASINAGIYFLSREVLVAIPAETMVSLEYDVFPKLVGKGLFGFASHGDFLDIGTPEDFALAEAFFTTKDRQ
jgi:NDP-sugar pyrophosphorylase family protein